LGQISKVLDEASKIGTVEWIFFEGGEPFLFFPIMIEGIKRARQKGFDVGVVTNAYGAITKEDARFWLRPLLEAGISGLNISNDAFHYGEEKDNPAKVAALVAKELGIAASSICIEKPRPEGYGTSGEDKGRPVVGGGPMFRGRAVEKLTK
jgi:MoaA/NifB/PqqE/SkfB family radical SAM enzyme